MATFDVTGGRVELDLPSKDDCRGEGSARRVDDALTSVTAYHARALTTYTFYEVLDQWLGPWGVQGYPIGYGKFYNIQFTRSNVMRSPEGRQWIETTTVALQNALRRYVLNRVRQGSLGRIIESELRRAAFDSHPECYTTSGLARIVLLDPFLIPYIAAIPGKEYVPTSSDFGPTIKQALETLAMVAPLSAGLTVAYAMPAHSGYLRRAAAIDARRYHDMMTFGHRMEQLRRTISTGGVDHIPVLNQIISTLVRGEHRDEGEHRVVSDLVRAAEKRRSEVLARYDDSLRHAAPELRESIGRQTRGGTRR